MLSYRSIFPGIIKLRMMAITGLYAPIQGNDLGASTILRRIHQATYKPNICGSLKFAGDFNS
jgi:hypothetical protein